MVELWRAAAPALVILVTPFLASAAAALLCAGVHAWLKRRPGAGPAAGEWLAARAAAAVPGVQVGVSPEVVGSMDGYWPDSRVIGVSPRTWVDRSPAGRAVVAHELGHALAWVAQPAGARIRAALRRLHAHAVAVAGAGALTAALLDSAAAAQATFAALVVALIGHAATVVDEVDASRRAAAVLGAAGERTAGTDAAMAAAAAVYLAPAAVHLAVLVAFEPLMAWMLAPSRVAAVDDDLTRFAVVGLAPFLVLRGMQVVADLRRSTPIRSELRLQWTLFLERSWEFHAGIIVVIWLALAWDEPIARGLAPLFVVGAAPAMGALGGLGRLLVVVPLAVALAAAGALTEPARVVGAPRPLEPWVVVPAPPTGWARAAGLIRVAWAPLAVVLLARAVG